MKRLLRLINGDGNWMRLPVLIFRTGFSLVLFFHVAVYILRDWVTLHYTKFDFFIPYPLLPFIHPASAVVFWGIFFSLLFISIGTLFSRERWVWFWLFFFGYGYLFLLNITYYNNHYYLLLLICFLFSVFETYNRFSYKVCWPTMYRTFQVQWILVYFFAGLAKLMHPDWGRGIAIHEWLQAWETHGLFSFIFGSYLFSKLAAIMAVFFQLTCFLGVFIPYLRWVYIVFFFSFHFLNEVVFFSSYTGSKLGVFPYLGMLSVVLFLPASFWLSIPRWCQDCRSKLRVSIPRLSRFRRHLILMFFIIQIALGLRHFFIPGDVRWSEDGRFMAYQDTVIYKKVKASVWVKETILGSALMLPLDQILTPYQLTLFQNPTLIYQFLEMEYRFFQEKYGVEVPIFGTDVQVSLNGRPFQTMNHPIPVSEGLYYQLVPKESYVP